MGAGAAAAAAARTHGRLLTCCGCTSAACCWGVLPVQRAPCGSLCALPGLHCCAELRSQLRGPLQAPLKLMEQLRSMPELATVEMVGI